MKTFTLLLIAILLFLGCSFVLSNYVIDSFSDNENGGGCSPSQIFSMPNYTQYVQNVSGSQRYPDTYCTFLYSTSSAFGGYRRVTLHSMTRNLTYAPQTESSMYIYSGNLNINQGADYVGSTQIVYQGNHMPNCGSTPNYLCSAYVTDLGPYIQPGIDITESGMDNSFEFYFLYSGEANIQLTVISSNGASGSASVTTSAPPTSNGGYTGENYVIPFSQFGSSVDFTSVSSISLLIQKTTGADYSISDFSTVYGSTSQPMPSPSMQPTYSPTSTPSSPTASPSPSQSSGCPCSQPSPPPNGNGVEINFFFADMLRGAY